MVDHFLFFWFSVGMCVAAVQNFSQRDGDRIPSSLDALLYVPL